MNKYQSVYEYTLNTVVFFDGILRQILYFMLGIKK